MRHPQRRAEHYHTISIRSLRLLSSCEYVPLGQVQHEVAGGAFGEAGHAEPARLAVGGRAGVAGECVSDDLTAGARAGQLGRVSQVADDGDAGERSGRRGAECAGGAGRSSQAAEEREGGHGGRCIQGVCLRLWGCWLS